ncbi:MAG: hypothetical protein QOF83_1819 [Solirubrobacteraceae bacterium]|jgi:hypothetical protein|nr:hypothetical protein [Solirubrobacteraceae bacterium]
MKIRKAVMVLAAMCATLLAAPVAASAATTTTATSMKNVPVTGKAHNGKAFNGHLTVTRFVTRSGKTYALGTLTGKLGTRTIKARQVALPAALPSSALTGAIRGSAAATCPILHLTLGPLDLNLLGLKVHLNQVVLNIDAQSGPGNLLGNLLCSLSNLLNSGSPLSNTLTGVLNIVQQLLNNPALLNL